MLFRVIAFTRHLIRIIPSAFFYIAVAVALFLIARYQQFDQFISATFTSSCIFLLLFTGHYGRYQNRIGVGKAGERAVREMLGELHVEALHDVYLPSANGSVQIDHVALFPNSLAVIETKKYNGIFAMNSLTLWQRVGPYGRKYQIANPLQQLEASKRNLSRRLPTTNIWGLVVMAGRHSSLTRYPPNVKSLAGLRDYIIQHRQKYGEWRYSEEILMAWRQLQELQREHASFSKTHVMEVRRRRGDRWYRFDETWLLWLWGGLGIQSALLTALAYYEVI